MAYLLTSLGISVLALLRERPMHGYEILRRLTASHADGMLKVRPGSLFHVVNRLTDEKLIQPIGTARNGNRPERTAYELTGAGADALSARLRDLLAGPVNESEKFVVGLAEIHHLDAASATEALRRRVAALELSAVELRGLRAADALPNDRAALDYMLATTAAKLEWLARFVDSAVAR